jgi:PAS domain S-box-containing protein
METENITQNELSTSFEKLKKQNRRLNNKLKKCRGRLDSAFKYAAIGMTFVSPEGKFLRVNPALCKMLGYSREELLSKTFQDITHPDDLDRDVEYVRQMLDGEIDTYQMDKRYFKKSGEIFWVHLSVSLVKKKSGKPRHFISQIVDIDKRKKTESALRKIEGDYKQLINTAQEGIWIIDDEAKTTFANDSMAEMLGYTEQEILGRRLFDFMDEKAIEEAKQLFQRRAKGINEVHDFRFKHKNGTDVWVIIATNALYDEQGNFTGSLGMLVDITQRKRLEQELSNTNKLLYGIVDYSKYLIYAKDPDGCFILASQSLVELFGMKEQTELIGKSSHDFLPKHIADQHRDNDIHVMKTKKIYNVEENVEQEAGFLTYLSVKFPLFKDDDEVYAVCGISIDITERKNLELKLKESEANFKALFDAINESVCMINKDGRILAANKTFAKRINLPVDECIGAIIYNLVQPKIARQRRSYVEKILKENKPVTFEDKRQDIWMSHSLYPIVDEYGNVNRIVIYAIDITDKKLVIEELKKSNLYNRNLIESSIDPLVTISEDGMITDVNKATENATGLFRNDLIGTEFSKYFTDTEKARKGVERVFSDGKVNDYALELRNKNGSSISVLYNASVLKDENGQVVGAFAAARDITKRRQAEKALRESEQRVKAKLDSLLQPGGDVGELELDDILDSIEVQALMYEFYELTHIGIGLVDMKGKVLVGCGWQDVCTKFHRINMESCKNCIDSDLYLSNGVKSGEYKIYKCKNNMWDMATPIIIGGKHLGNIFLGQFFFEDEVPEVSVFKEQAKKYGFDEKEYLEALDNVPRWTRDTVDHAMKFYSKLGIMLSKISYSNLKLAKLVEDLKRTKEALSESELQLRELNSSKDKFFSIIAHDLRSPLSGFIKLSEDLTKNFMELSPNDVKEYSRGLYQSSTYLFNLLDNLLEWSRMQRNISTVKPEKLKVLQQVIEIKKIFKLQAEQKKINIQITIDPHAEVIADKNMLLTVLRNLISNAIKFSFPNSTIEIYSILTKSKTVINIKDQGKGIPQGKQDEIFNLGETYTQMGTNNEKGTGLGLLLCKELVERNNGRLWFISTEMRETIFSFSLPTA